MESTTEALEVQREIEIAASPETVWEFLVDPEKALRWWGQAVRGDARPGGELRIEVTTGSIAGGRVLEADPPRRLVFTWGWERGGGGPEILPPGSTTVEIDLVPSGAGTMLRLVHRGLPDEDSAARHSEGWEHYLGLLAVAAPGRRPGARPMERPGSSTDCKRAGRVTVWRRPAALRGCAPLRWTTRRRETRWGSTCWSTRAARWRRPTRSAARSWPSGAPGSRGSATRCSTWATRSPARHRSRPTARTARRAPASAATRSWTRRALDDSRSARRDGCPDPLCRRRR